MTNTVHTQFAQNIFQRQSHAANGEQPRSGVWQDNPTPRRERIASDQPGSVQNDTRSHQTNSNSSRSQKKPIPKRRTAQLILWVHPLVKAEIQRTAEREGLSVSKVGAALLEKAIQRDIHSQHDALLYPMIQKVIREELHTFGNRTIFFLMRIAFAAEQARILITNVLDRMSEVTQESFTHIIDRSHITARKNIINKSEPMKTLLDEYERLFTDEGKGGDRK